MRTGKLSNSVLGISASKDEANADSDCDIDFCNTPEGYLEMGKQLGVAFAAIYS